MCATHMERIACIIEISREPKPSKSIKTQELDLDRKTESKETKPRFFEPLFFCFPDVVGFLIRSNSTVFDNCFFCLGVGVVMACVHNTGHLDS